MMSMIIRGSFKRLLAESLRYTANMNKRLVEHYRNYPSKPQSFEQWREALLNYLGQAYSRFS
jgi:digeranylgeranylglycerophospholipid reductase